MTEFVLEDSAGIVEKAPLNVAINLWTRDFSEEEDLPELSEDNIALISTKFYGATLEDRLKQMKNSEQMLLALLFNQEITFEYFQTRVESLIQDEDLRNLFLDITANLYDKGFKVVCSLPSPYLHLLLV